ncbi:unnamed protein product [Adineta steineri]|uniref:Uncharacterized protein n=1 Tax=Adineta steineri TaxID=433720 RepID=A0A815X3X3_9BILA|nr:unnamed protein product [Adineta steineri]CAF1552013.1 unnamed protein product [Adineta steineri]
MATHDKLSFLLILCFFGLVMHLCSGFVVPSEDCSNNGYTKAELDNSCIGKNVKDEQSTICNEYCENVPTIGTSKLPSLLAILGPLAVNKIQVGCVGYCSQENTCLCAPASDALFEEPGKINVAGVNPEQTIFFSTVYIDGKNVTLTDILCEDPK